MAIDLYPITTDSYIKDFRQIISDKNYWNSNNFTEKRDNFFIQINNFFYSSLIPDRYKSAIKFSEIITGYINYIKNRFIQYNFIRNKIDLYILLHLQKDSFSSLIKTKKNCRKN